MANFRSNLEVNVLKFTSSGSGTIPEGAKYVKFYANGGICRITSSNGVAYDVPTKTVWEWPYNTQNVGYKEINFVIAGSGINVIIEYMK